MVDVVWIVYIFIPNIALFPCVHLFFNFLLFLLSQIVKLKTKKIKPFCFRARKILSFVDVAFGVSLPFLVCTCVCVSFCFNEKFDFSAVLGELRAIAVVFSLIWRNDLEIRRKKTCSEHWRGNKSVLFSIVFICSLKPIELHDDGTINKIADSGSIETNEKNVGKCRDSTKRKVSVLEVLIRVWFFSTFFLRGCFI